MTIPLVTFIGKPGAGKTSFLEKPVFEMKSRRYRIATIRHHSQAGFDIDVPVPHFFNDDVAGAADFLVSWVANRSPHPLSLQSGQTPPICNRVTMG